MRALYLTSNNIFCKMYGVDPHLDPIRIRQNNSDPYGYGSSKLFCLFSRKISTCGFTDVCTQMDRVVRKIFCCGGACDSAYSTL